MCIRPDRTPFMIIFNFNGVNSSTMNNHNLLDCRIYPIIPTWSCTASPWPKRYRLLPRILKTLPCKEIIKKNMTTLLIINLVMSNISHNISIYHTIFSLLWNKFEWNQRKKSWVGRIWGTRTGIYGSCMRTLVLKKCPWRKTK